VFRERQSAMLLRTQSRGKNRKGWENKISEDIIGIENTRRSIN
jgi:hypothetical protein